MVKILVNGPHLIYDGKRWERGDIVSVPKSLYESLIAKFPGGYELLEEDKKKEAKAPDA